MISTKSRIFIAFGVLLAACATEEYHYISIEPLKNDLGHTIGQKETLLDPKTGERFDRTIYYTPRLDSKGAIVGYEEPASRGTILRGLDGRRVGVRYSDLRSRDTNPKSEGVTVIIAP